MQQAAAALGISAEAVRQRIKRNTIPHERDSGTVYVILDADTTRPNDDPTGDRTGDQSPLVASLQEQIEHLRWQINQANERDRENRRIIAGLVQRVPELEAPATTEARESPEGPSPSPTPTQIAGEPETPAQRRPWWRRLFER